jgi:hypothetical protein
VSTRRVRLVTFEGDQAVAKITNNVARAGTLFRDVIPREPTRDRDADERHPDHHALIAAAAPAVACCVANRETHSQHCARRRTDHGAYDAAFGLTRGSCGRFSVWCFTLQHPTTPGEAGAGSSVLELCQFE